MLHRALAIVVPALLALVTGAAPARADVPDNFTLPAGFQPEGIAISKPYAYLGSRANGDILRIDLTTGDSETISDGFGTPSLGMKTDGYGRLFVAGGRGGDARVIDLDSGQVLRDYQLQTGSAFVNDVVLTAGAAWFTDSVNPVLYELPLGPDGELPSRAVQIPITGAMTYQSGLNANGITGTPGGDGLLVVQTNTGRLFRVSFTGFSTRVDVGQESLLYGDGMWLRGHTLWLVQNRDNVITKIRLDRTDPTKATVLSRTKDVRFDVPSTLAAWNGNFYLPNARYTSATTSATPYNMVMVAIP